MTLTEEQIREVLADHDLTVDYHDDVQAPTCRCKHAGVVAFDDGSVGLAVVTRPPMSSGNSCHDCGGIMVQTGTCETCTGCGSTGGCG